MVIDHNKKMEVVNPKSFSPGGKPKPKPIVGKPNPNPQQVHLHEKDDFTQEQIPDNPTQAMVHECLAACGIDPSDIQDVMSVLNVKMSCQFIMSKMALHNQNPQDNLKSTKGVSLLELTSLQIT